MSLPSRPERLPRRHLLILAGVSLASLGVYLLASRLAGGFGFPLDDAWIHQTYARSLAQSGQWAFLPGQPSAGSTAPLWSLLLAAGAFLRLAPYAWTYLLGALLLWGLACLAESTLRSCLPEYTPKFPWAGSLVALDWHLAWSAGSGMETLLSALLVLLVLKGILIGWRPGFGAGLLVGAAVWVRPDGITLLGPALLAAVLFGGSWRQRLSAPLKVLLGFAGLFALYLLFNLRLAGSPFPNTFYAKQAEYAVYLRQPFLMRLVKEPFQLIVGAGALLLPGAVLALVRAAQRRQWGAWIAAAWGLGFIALYAWRLPVTYQYGRYILPILPLLLLLGLAGMLEFSPPRAQDWRWVLAVSWKAAAALTLLLFWVRGAAVYARDVSIINDEMVATARWVNAHLPPQALVAAHDIGALGYFGGYDLVDIAGLISPEVIPFLRDEAALSAYLDSRGVDYLVTFPDWYPELTAGRVPVFTADSPALRSMGELDMAVYRWKSP